MPWVKSDDDEFEYRTLEWRAFQEDEVRAQIQQLLADGWELDGGEGVKSGSFADLYWQMLKRRKAPPKTKSGN